jgi:hypothetical protein
MIVREIVNDIEYIIERFDWFNDYKDTRLYLIESKNQEKIIDKMDKQFEIIII